MRIFRMIIECSTPLHCGGGAEDILQDQPVTRDAFGLWRIPGSSLAGVLRGLCDSVEPAMTGKMFGESGGEPRPSLVWCADGILLDFDGLSAPDKMIAGQQVEIPQGPFVRDHVRLDCDRGCAVEGGKFDEEIVPAGARFLLEFRCDGWNRKLTDEECACFDRLCALALGGALDLGGKTANGYGRYRVIEKSCREIDLFDPAGMEAWLNLSRGKMPQTGEGRELDLAPALEALPDAGLNGTAQMSLVCDGPILIGGGQPVLPDGSLSDADIIFALSPYLDYGRKKLCWRPVLPGTSLKGVLRHAVYRILRDGGASAELAQNRLNDLFGHIEGNDGQCGRLVVEDCPLLEARQGTLVQHVAIDRFTGGALDGALFSEEPVWIEGLEVQARIHARGADGAGAALIFQALLDLGQGLLGVGSGVNRGNGRLRAKMGTEPGAVLESAEGNLAFGGRPLLAGDAGARLATLAELAHEWEKCGEARR